MKSRTLEGNPARELLNSVFWLLENGNLSGQTIVIDFVNPLGPDGWKAEFHGRYKSGREVRFEAGWVFNGAHWDFSLYVTGLAGFGDERLEVDVPDCNLNQDRLAKLALLIADLLADPVKEYLASPEGQDIQRLARAMEGIELEFSGEPKSPKEAAAELEAEEAQRGQTVGLEQGELTFDWLVGLGLTVRTANILLRAGVKKVDILRSDEDILLMIRQFGEKRLEELRSALKKHGIKSVLTRDLPAEVADREVEEKEEKGED